MVAGGTISLADGTQVDLRRSLIRRWKLQATDTKQRVVDIRISSLARSAEILLEIESLPVGITDLQLVVLTAYAVLILHRTIPDAGGGG
jgi:hypothetical protein